MSEDKETLKKLRREFGFLVNHCGCSRVSLHITKEEATKRTKELYEDGRYGKVSPHIPHCTPKKYFPVLYSLLYPKGGFHGVSYMVENFRKKVEHK